MIDRTLLANLSYPLRIDNPFICESDDLHDGVIFNIERLPLHLIQMIFYANENIK